MISLPHPVGRTSFAIPTTQPRLAEPTSLGTIEREAA
jgi:hypothetical protein